MVPENVLIVDDNSEFRTGLKRMLEEWGFGTTVVSHGMEAWREFLKVDAPRIAIVDWRMPRMDGLQLCRMIRNRIRDHYVYIIMLTACEGELNLPEAFSCGVDEFLTKPFLVDELQARLRTAQRIVNLSRDNQRIYQDLKDRNMKDKLTGCWNRRGVLSILKHELNRTHRSGSVLGLILVELKDFDRIRDLCGSVVSDHLAVRVTRELRMAVRCYDEIGRTAAGQFLLILPGCSPEPAQRLAVRIREQVENAGRSEEMDPFSLRAQLGVVTTSQFSPQDSRGLLRTLERTILQNRAAVHGWISTAREACGVSLFELEKHPIPE